MLTKGNCSNQLQKVGSINLPPNFIDCKVFSSRAEKVTDMKSPATTTAFVNLVESPANVHVANISVKLTTVLGGIQHCRHDLCCLDCKNVLP